MVWINGLTGVFNWRQVNGPALVVVTLTVLCIQVNAQLNTQQYFRVQPHDKKVQEKRDVILECEIANLAGAPQWTKDGFGLGFTDGIIPGFPRYKVVVDKVHGIYNLQIRNASLEDDAEYQCQVGPFKSHKAIRARANLTVISPPSSIEILNHPPNAKIEIRENQELTLECHARNAKPAATIVWYRGNKEYKADKRDDNTQKVEVTSNRKDNKKIIKYNTSSRITLVPSAEDDYADFTCEARHEALPADLPMRTTVQLSVLYPPGMPYIDGYTDGETIRRGQQVSLVCRSRGGNPPAQLIWYRNGEQVRMAYRTSGRMSENTLTFTAEAKDDKARYKCEASNVMSQQRPLQVQVDLTVFFAPAQVLISGPTEARVGDPVPLTCTTANSNPAAEIKWMVAGKQIRNATDKKILSSEGGWITTSNITVLIEPGQRSLVVVCHGLNQQLTENVLTTHNINVLYPPSQPIIQGYVSEKPISSGTLKKMLCISTGGNPLATLTWYKNNKKINAVSTKTDKSVQSEITMLVNATDNNAEYRCEATNAATEIPLFETVKLNVLFSPETVKIHQNPNEIKPNTLATLTCDSSSSHPPAKLTWWRDGIAVENSYNTTKPGLHGGFVSTMELSINVTEEMNGDIYICQASNEALQKSVHESVTLQVLYKPKFVDPPSHITGVENEPLEIVMKAEGNPPGIVYTWTKDGVPISRVSSVNANSLDRVISDGPVLNISRLVKSDAGAYTCEASNSQGGTVIRINVTVQYGATITNVSKDLVVNPKSEATLSCTVDASPMTDSTITWIREDYDFSSRTTAVYYAENNTSFLHVHNVNRSDNGEFICRVDNGIGNSTELSMYLLVKFKPEFDLSPFVIKSAADSGAEGRLRCRVFAAPKVRFTWSRNGAVIPVNTSSKFGVEYIQVDRLTYESVLIIKDVKSSDYGAYECVARNEMGFSSTSIKLDVTSAPDTPISISVLNSTHESVTIAWTPGFNGGMKSTYRIRYRLISEDGYKYQDVNNENQTMLTVHGLDMDSEYVFSVMALNKLGASKFLPDLTRARTSSDPNVLQLGADLTRGSKILNTVVVFIGLCVLLVNIFLIVYYVLTRRSNKIKEPTTQNSKSATIEMYAPSSYNDTVTGETLSSVSEKSETYSNGESNADYVDENRKQANSTYLVDPNDYQSAYPPNYPAYEMQMNSRVMLDSPMSMSHKTQTLPHPHHHHHHLNAVNGKDDYGRSKDDQSLGNMNINEFSSRASFISAPSPALPVPPADGSYYNMSDRYLSYPPPPDFNNPSSTAIPPPIPTPPINVNGTLRRQKATSRSNMTVPPPDVLHNTNNIGSNQQILHAQGLQARDLMRNDCLASMTTFANYQTPMEQEGHLV